MLRLAMPLLLACLLASNAAAESPISRGTTAGRAEGVSAEGSAYGLTWLSSTAVTPTADLTSGDFVRVFENGDKILVTFSTTLSSALVPGTCSAAGAYAYREFDRDMTPTGRQGVISCGVRGDNGGLLVGDRFYLAVSGIDDTVFDGWNLSMYDAASWSTLPAAPAAPLTGPTTHALACGMRAGDPVLAVVNGLVDIDGKYLGPDCCGGAESSWPAWCLPASANSFTTHHNFFDPATFSPAPCPPSCPLTLPVPPNPGHIDMDSLWMEDGYINLMASTGSSIFGDLVLIRLDSAWSYVDSKVLREHAWGPEGVATYRGRHYVSFLDSSTCGGALPCAMNARLAVFDGAWTAPPLGEIALTSFATDSGMTAQKATLLLVGDTLYVATVSSLSNDVSTAQVTVDLFRIGPAHRLRRRLSRE